jgi:hypothetical protein
MLQDGNLVSLTADNTPVWATMTHNNPGAFLSLQTDGNLVIYNSRGTTALWASNTYGKHARIDGQPACLIEGSSLPVLALLARGHARCVYLHSVGQALLLAH